MFHPGCIGVFHRNAGSHTQFFVLISSVLLPTSCLPWGNSVIGWQHAVSFLHEKLTMLERDHRDLFPTISACPPRQDPVGRRDEPHAPRLSSAHPLAGTLSPLLLDQPSFAQRQSPVSRAISLLPGALLRWAVWDQRLPARPCICLTKGGAWSLSLLRLQPNCRNSKGGRTREQGAEVTLGSSERQSRRVPSVPSGTWSCVDQLSRGLQGPRRAGTALTCCSPASGETPRRTFPRERLPGVLARG